MGSRSTKALLGPALALVEVEAQYAPAGIAEVIQNLEPTLQGTLRCLRGPVRYELHDDTAFGEQHGVFHAELGQQSVLLMRAGTKLYRHRGWERDWEEIETGLNEPQGAWAPDQWAVINGRVIWANGIDHPRIITADGRVELLGFWQRPEAPRVQHPITHTSTTQPPNWNGYSWHGRIGTAGDTLEGQYGAILEGHWDYAIQYEDDFGDLSPISVVSVATLRVQQANPYARINGLVDKTHGYSIDDLTKQFLVTTGDVAPEKVAAIRVLRSRNTYVEGGDLRFLERIPSRRPVFYSDPHSDPELGSVVEGPIPTPRFHVMSPYRGGLAAAAGGVLYLSEAGFPGTFFALRSLIPDSNGDAITGLTVVGGKLFCFTRRALYAIIDDAEGLREQPISQSVGCAAPGSLGHLLDGRLIWRTTNGWHQYDPRNGSLAAVSDQHGLLLGERLNPQRAVQSSAVVYKGQYYCSVALDSTERCNHLVAYDGLGWRRFEIGYSVQAMAVTDDARALMLFAGRLSSGANTRDIWVWDHEVLDQVNPAKQYVYETTWLRADKDGLERFTVKGLLMGLLEASNATIAITVWINQRRTNGQTYTSNQIAEDFSKQLNSLILGTDTLQRPALEWRRLALMDFSCRSFKVRIESTEPTFFHLARLGFEIAPVDKGGRLLRSSD